MPDVTILTGDCREVLKTLPDASVQCCVTSPPYWGLRDYGTARWDGGDAGCEHEGSERYYTERAAASCSADAFHEAGADNAESLRKGRWRENGQCVKCGAIKIDGQIGLEATPEEYVAKLVEVFREVKRVLRDDGTLWLNLGDSYANDGKWGGSTGGKHVEALHGNNGAGRGKRNTGLKPKDLVGIPWMVAFALRSDGWWLRQEIIWNKPNPMPESVTDRCTKSHEQIFLLAKSQTYHCDMEAIKEPGAEVSLARAERADLRLKDGWADAYHGAPPTGLKRGRTGKTAMRGQGHFREHETGPTNRDGRDMAEVDANADGKRNKRSVWTVNSRPYKEAHFATYPPDLIKPCIMAGCPMGGTLLDPFGGSGTTGQVALELGRSAILIELNEKYAGLIQKRTDVTPGLALS